MYRPRRRLPTVLATLAALVSLLAIPASSRDWRQLPWHLADIWWEVPAETIDFQSLSIDLAIAGEELGELPLYLAAIGWGEIDGAPLYAGVQSGGRLENGAAGHLGIFSRWQERERDAIRAAPEGYAVSSGSEGDFISVRRPIPWRQGRYRFSLTVEAPHGADPRPWVRAELLEFASGTRWQIGALRFPGGARVRLAKSFASFVEIFGASPAPSLPHVTVTFSNLRINDLPALPTEAVAIYDQDVPPLAAAEATAPGVIAVDIGPFHSRGALSPDSKGRLNQRLRWRP